MGIRGTKAYHNFAKRNLAFLQQCKKDEDDINTFTKNALQFQNKLSQVIDQRPVIKSAAKIQSRKNKLNHLVHKSMQLSRSMIDFHKKGKNYHKQSTKFLDRVTKQVSKGHLPNPLFMEENQRILLDELGGLKKDMERLKKQQGELKITAEKFIRTM